MNCGCGYLIWPLAGVSHLKGRERDHDYRPGESPARLALRHGVALLYPEDTVFEVMLEGWARQHRGGRRLQPKTISDG